MRAKARIVKRIFEKRNASVTVIAPGFRRSAAPTFLFWGLSLLVLA